MFKLIKIVGARTNVPEPVSLHIDGVEEYFAGSCYFYTEGIVSNYLAKEDDIKFVPLESVPKNSGKTKITGYFVNENMVFETEIYGDHTAVKVGDTLLGYVNDDNNISAVAAETGYDVKLLSLDEAATTHKVLVALKW